MQNEKINGFTLQHLLGTGGMAEVWYAESKIGTKAAVKILSEELSHNAQMQERFLNDAKVMVQLDHPNIRKVYGSDNPDYAWGLRFGSDGCGMYYYLYRFNGFSVRPVREK